MLGSCQIHFYNPSIPILFKLEIKEAKVPFFLQLFKNQITSSFMCFKKLLKTDSFHEITSKEPAILWKVI